MTFEEAIRILSVKTPPTLGRYPCHTWHIHVALGVLTGIDGAMETVEQHGAHHQALSRAFGLPDPGPLQLQPGHGAHHELLRQKVMELVSESWQQRNVTGMVES